MKVWINRLPREYSAGLIIVAAHDSIEADKIYYEWLKKYDYTEIWNLDYSRELTFEEYRKSDERNQSRYVYHSDTWEELVGVNYDGDTARIITEESYIE